MRALYNDVINWLVGHPSAGYWAVAVGAGFLILFLLYLGLTILRLQRHILKLKGDKRRLMEEKDLMRMGMVSNAESSSPENSSLKTKQNEGSDAESPD
jgi:hypothetical protein